MASRVSGVGVGLRIEFARALLGDANAPVDFVEVHPENHVDRGGAHATMLRSARGRFPVLTHGLTMGFATATAIARDDLRRLRAFLDEVDAPFHSDHFCFARAASRVPHELLPPRFDEATIRIAAESVARMRDVIGRDVAIENVSYYVPRSKNPLDEVDALVEIVERADAKLLLDVNNIVVNAYNHGFDPLSYLARIPFDRVVQIHVAGHLLRPDGLRIDTHGAAVGERVLELLPEVLRATGPVPVLLERDADFPSYDELASELRRLRRIYDTSLPEEAARQTELTDRIPTVRLEIDPLEDEPKDVAASQRAVVDHLFARERVGLGKGHVARRWDLYRAMARDRLRTLVIGALPRTRRVLGEHRFDEVFDRYLDAGGPASPIFWRVVEEVATSFDPGDDTFLRDVIALEVASWRIRQAPFPNAPAFTSFDFDNPVVLSPAIVSFDASHAVHEGDDEAARASLDARIVVVRKPDESAGVLSLNRVAASLFDRLREGASAKEATVTVAADRALALDLRFVESLAGVLAQWIEVGLVLGVAPRQTA